MTLRSSWWLLSFILLSGCMGPATRPWPSEQPSGTQNPSGKLDFGWRLSGDRAVAPLQVFSDSSRTWLQWLPGQLLPIILGASAQGEQVLSYVRQGPYTILEGVYPVLSFRSAGLQARARRLSAVAAWPAASPLVSEPEFDARGGARPQQTPEAKPVSDSRTSAQPNASATPRPFFSVSHTDLHLRQALTRWAGLSGWRFETEHWALDSDIPLSASASFSDDFVTSVQALLASTELSERPLQPCFYSNQVLRIVPLAEPCDRSMGDGAST